MRKLLFAFVAVASLVGFIVPDASAQVLSPSAYAYPAPGKSTDAPVICTTCVNATKNLPTWPYSLPVKRFVGRILDSSRARDIQGNPYRTLRGRDFRISTQNGRVYSVFGGARLAAWNLNTFFTSDLGRPLTQVQPTYTGTVGSYNNTPELYLNWAAGVDADLDGSWRTITVDGQNRLGGFDSDDRGYVYLAYGPYGWGIIKDNGPSGFAFISQTTDKGPLVPPNDMQVLRSGTSYYGVIMNPGGSDQSAVFDVTTPASPNFIGYTTKAPVTYEKIASDHSVQDDILATVAGGTRALEIYTTSQFINGRAPAKTITATTGVYWDITSDGTNFYAMHGIGANQDIDLISPTTPGDASTYRVVTTYHIPGGSNAGEPRKGLRWGGGYLTLTARDANNQFDVRLFKVTNGEFKDIDLQKFFQKYYTAPPSGYAKPDANTSLFTTSVVYSAGGRDYLIFGSYGMADVYELQAGDSVDVTMNSSYGTRNPNSTTTDGPYYGDPITFSSLASTAIPMTLNWDFGNPESANNTTTNQSGTNVTHQYAGITLSSQITTTKTVTATNAADSAVSDTQPVTMLLPTARVGVAGTTLLLQPNASATAMVPGDLLMDASDGSVEGHYNVWTIDSTNTTGTPLEKVPVGTCGAHTLTYEAHYIPYTGTGSLIVPAPLVSPFIRDVSNVSYTVAPIVADLKVSSYDTLNVTFKNMSRAASAATFNAGATWTQHLIFYDAAGGVFLDVPAKTSPVGTQDTFTVIKSQIANAKKAVLTITIDNTSIAATACQSATSTSVSASAEMAIALPDPTISATGCGNVGSPCTISASSVSSASMTGWTFAWKMNGGLISTTTSSFTPTISSAGSYQFEVAATNAFGTASATKSVTVQAPLCTGAPHDITINANPSCASSGTCTTNTTILFGPYAWGYSFQSCDTFLWTFGDGTTSTQRSPSKKYNANGSYNVTLKVSNSNGNSSGTWTVIIGTVAPPPPPPPTCPTSAPSNIYVSLSAQSGCSAANPNCKTSDTITFVPAPWGYTLQTCDEYLWTFGDGTSSTSRNATHVYANPGTYPVKLTVSNDKGTAVSDTVTLVITSGGGTGNCPSAPGAFNGFSYSGATSHCSGPSTPCSISETVTFNAVYFSDTQRACDVITWDFGDGTATTTGKTVNHAYTRQGTFPVKMTISNSLGSMNATLNLQVGGSGGTPPPVVDFTIGNPSPAVGTAVSFTGNLTSGGPIVSWNWNFGDGTTGSGQTVSHTYTTPGAKTVTLTAANSGNSAVVSKSLTVADANSFAFLLPVVTHLDNEDGSKWQTDLQFFNPTPNFDPTSPMVLSFEFKGQTKTLTFDKSTDIRKDFLNYLTVEKTSGSVIVRGTGNYPPQMWTRTYIVTPSGIGTYGQLIPAIPLTSQQAAGGVIPKQYLPGLHFGPKGSASKFRTNIGLVNPSAAASTITMGFLDKDGLPVGATFNTTVQPYSLIQVNDGAIRTSVPQIDPAKAYTVELTSTAAGLMAYASIVDNTSNDPVFVQAVSETEAASASRKVQMLPGLSHFNTPAGDSWRSDVTVYNADEHTIQFDMELLGTDGTKVAEAKNITLGGSQSLQLDDMLTTPTPVPVPAGAQAGTLRLTTNIGTEFPIMYSRTYNDRAAAGTFGQGIPAFSGTEGNVSVGKPAYIAGVRSNSSYYTNLGLVSASDTASTVSVKMLEPIRGTVIGQQTYTVNPGQSLIVGSANSDFLHTLAPSMDEQGTIEIEVTSGGNVWGFVSIIDKLTKDPEYVPATPGN